MAVRYMPQTEILVIGGGVAGLEAALMAARAGKQVTLISKGETASNGILGFCAPVSETDSVERYETDTWQGGWKIGRPELVHALAADSAATVTHLEELGLTFDRNDQQQYQLLKPLGCSVPRLVKHENVTGKASMQLLRKELVRLQVTILDRTAALELMTENGRVCGAACAKLDDDEIYLIPAGAVVLACGGAHLMKNSTYPMDQTADGFAMAWHAGAELTDLEFVQHEPCRAVWPKPLGISTTLLAKGGILTNSLGERFILDDYPSEGAVPKDMLARLIAKEICEGRGTEHGGVWLDLTGIPEEEIKLHHVLYYERFMNVGIDLTREKVEVGPSAHSMMGGIRIDADGCTGIPGLFAAGENTGGLHGANRLGGNAGAEVYVFGRRAGIAAAKEKLSDMPSEKTMKEMADRMSWDVNAAVIDDEAERATIREMMAKAVGPIRQEQILKDTEERLEKKLTILNASLPESQKKVRLRYETRHLCETALLVCRAALTRTESRGVHYRSDWPDQDDARWKKSIIWKKSVME